MDEETVESAKTRLYYTNDIASLILIISLVVTTGYAIYNGIDLDYHYAYVLAVLSATAWLFGEVVKDIRK